MPLDGKSLGKMARLMVRTGLILVCNIGRKVLQMIDKQFMKLLIILLLLLGSSSSQILSAESDKVWTPLSMEEIATILSRDDLSNVKKIEALTRQLDRRITLSNIKDRGSKRDSTDEYTTLMAFIAVPGLRTDTPKDPEAIKTVLSELDTTEGIKNKEKVRTFLYIALGIAGGHSPEAVLLSFLNDPHTSKELLDSVLGAMYYGDVPIRALPRLLQLSHHPTNYIDPGPDVGIGPESHPQRIYPLREMAYRNLQKLGIQCNKVLLEDKTIEPQMRHKLFITEIRVNRASLVAKLRAWLLSDDPQVWQPAAEIARQIPGQDVQAMLHQLLQSGKLSAPKRAVIEKHPASLK